MQLPSHAAQRLAWSTPPDVEHITNQNLDHMLKLTI